MKITVFLRKKYKIESLVELNNQRILMARRKQIFKLKKFLQGTQIKVLKYKVVRNLIKMTCCQCQYILSIKNDSEGVKDRPIQPVCLELFGLKHVIYVVFAQFLSIFIKKGFFQSLTYEKFSLKIDLRRPIRISCVTPDRNSTISLNLNGGRHVIYHFDP